MENCELCQDDVLPSGSGEVQTVREKGYKNIIEHCVRLGKLELKARLETKWKKEEVITVHKECRSRLIKTKVHSDTSDDITSPRPKRCKANPDDKTGWYYYYSSCRHH